MPTEKILEILRAERECVERQGTMACPNRDCANCDLLHDACEIIEAYDAALEALEREPCNDAISRQAVLEQIDQWAIGNREYLHTDAMHYLARRIQDIPPVTPQPKMGRWINKHKYNTTYECDNCGRKNVKSNYCPNCGAKMEVEE